MTTKLLILGTVLSSTLTLVACNTVSEQQKNKERAAELHQSKIVRNIDAKFMRENIFDYKVNPNTFVFKGKRPAIIDFYADWCGPCRQLSPRLEMIAKKYLDKIDIYKVNVDDESELAAVFGVRSIPMLLFIGLDGQMPSVSQGALGEKELESEIQRILQTVK